MAHRPRKMTEEASPNASTDLTPSSAPRITMAILTYISGFSASLSLAAKPGMKLPMKMPARRAMMKPASPVSPMAHFRLNFLS